jgi:hypothetical protein
MYDERGFFGAFGSFLTLAAFAGAPPVPLAEAAAVSLVLLFGALEEVSRCDFEIVLVVVERAWPLAA